MKLLEANEDLKITMRMMENGDYLLRLNNLSEENNYLK